MEFAENSFFLLALTFGVFYLAQKLQKKTGWLVLNPILITIAVLICFLKTADVDYAVYSKAGSMVEFWLKPAIVALGVPLYQQLSTIRKQLMPIILSQFAGCLAGVISVTLIAKAMGAGREIILSLAPKSVTTPIAMEVSAAVGGIPALTAAVVICVGLFGAIFGFSILKMTKVRNPIAQGLSIGTASHAVGTARAMEVSGRYGAYASLGLIVNGVFTALFTPTVLQLLGI